MTDNEVIAIVQRHNQSIDDYINGELAKKLNAKNGKINMNQWFRAQELIKEQDFYGKGKKILRDLRSKGFDVKIDAQSDKLVYKWYR